jgi:hypothetical protein
MSHSAITEQEVDGNNRHKYNFYQDKYNKSVIMEIKYAIWSDSFVLIEKGSRLNAPPITFFTSAGKTVRFLAKIRPAPGEWPVSPCPKVIFSEFL